MDRALNQRLRRVRRLGDSRCGTKGYRYPHPQCSRISTEGHQANVTVTILDFGDCRLSGIHAFRYLALIQLRFTAHSLQTHADVLAESEMLPLLPESVGKFRDFLGDPVD